MSSYNSKRQKDREERLKQKENLGYSNYHEYRTIQGIMNGSDTLLSDYNTLIKNVPNTYKSAQKYVNNYSNGGVNDELRESMYNNTTSYNNLKSKLSKYRNSYVKAYGEDGVKTLENGLSAIGTSINNTSNAVTKATEFWGNFKTEEEYKQYQDINALKSMSNDEIMNALKNNGKYTYFNGDPNNESWVQESKVNNPKNIEDYISNYGDTNLLKQYRDYLLEGEEKTGTYLPYRNTTQTSTGTQMSLLPNYTNNTGAGSAVERGEKTYKYKDIDEEKINLLNSKIKIKESEKKFEDEYNKYSKADDWEEYSRNNINSLNGYDINNSIHNSNSYSADGIYNFINLKKEYQDLSPNLHSPNNDSELMKFQSMSDDEIKTYNYIYKKYGDDKALKYIDDITPVLNYRMTSKAEENAMEFASEHPVLGSVASVGTNILSAINGKPVGNAIKSVITGNDIDANSSEYLAQRATNAIRNQVASDIDSNVGRFIYQTASSAVDSAINLGVATVLTGGIGAVGEAVGSNALASAPKYTAEVTSALMGNSVATNAIIEGKEKGYSDIKALTLGIIQGAIEGVTEKYSIDRIIKNPNLLKSAVTEGTEEVASNWMNNIVDAVANGDKSEFNQFIKAYKKENPDATDGKAFSMAIVNSLKDDGLAFLGGAMAGSAMGGVQQGINYVGNSLTGKDIKNLDNVNTLVEIGSNLDTNGKAYKISSEISEKLANNKSVSNSLVSKLRTEIINETQQASNADLSTAIENRLVTLGEKSAKAKYLSNVAVKVINGDSLSTDEKIALGGSTQAQRVISEYNNSDKSNYTNEWSNNIQSKARTFNAMAQFSDKASLSSADVTKANVPIVGVNSVNNGDVTYNLSNGKTAKANELKLTNGFDVINNYAKSMNTEEANNYVAGYKELSADVNPETYNALWTIAKEAGINNNQQMLQDVANREDNVLSSKSLLNAFKAGVTEIAKTKNNGDTIKQAEPIKVDNNIKSESNRETVYNEYAPQHIDDISTFEDMFNRVYTAGTRGISYKSLSNNINYADVMRELSETEIKDILSAGKNDYSSTLTNEKVTKREKSKGEVKVSDEVHNNLFSNAKTEEDYDKILHIDTLNSMAETLGTDIVVEDIYDNNINGYIENGVIHINVNKTTEGILFTATHESIHFLRMNNEKGYRALRDFVFDCLTDKGVNIDSRVSKVIDAYLKKNALDINNLTDGAEEEIIANAFGSIIGNEQAMQKAYNLSTEKKNAIISAINKIIDRLKSFLKNLTNMSEVKALKDDINAQIKMAEIFADGLAKSNVQEGNSHEDVKYSRYAPKNRFEKALSKQDWVRFNSAIVNKKQSTGLRIGDNGVLLYNEDDIYNSKLICYDEIGNHIEVTAVYDLQNYDRNIHDRTKNIAKFIVDSVRSGHSEGFRNTILSNYNELSGTVFRKYNARTGRFVNIRRKNNTNGKSNGNKSRRGNNNQENKGNKIQLNDRNNVKLSIEELGETLPGTKFSVYESGIETQIKSATDNIGTFDKNNPDIRYSLDEDMTMTPEMMSEVETEKALEQTNNLTAKLLKQLFKDNKVTKASFVNSAEEVLSKYESTMSANSYAEAMWSLAGFARNNDNVTPSDLMTQMSQISNTAVDKTKKIIDPFEEERKEIRGQLKGHTLLLTDRQVQMLDFGMGTNRYKQLMFGTTNIKKAENHSVGIAGGIDRQGGKTCYLSEMYYDLQDQFGYALFPEIQEDMMPEELLRVLETLKPTVETVDGANRYDMSMAMTQDFIVALCSEVQNSTNTKLKQKYDKAIKELKDSQKEWKEKYREEYNNRLNRKLKEQKAKDAVRFNKRLNARDKKILEIKAKQRDKQSKRRDAMLSRDLKRKIQRKCKKFGDMLSNKKKTAKIPVELIKEISNLANVIDGGVTKNGNKVAGYNSFYRMSELYERISKYPEKVDKGYVLEYSTKIRDDINEIGEMLNGRAINEITSPQELEKIYNVLKEIEHNLKSANELLVEGRRIDYVTAGEHDIKAIEKLRGRNKKNGGISVWKNNLEKFVNFNNDPMRTIRFITGYDEDTTLYKCAKELDKATSKKYELLKKGREYFADISKSDVKRMKTFDGKQADFRDFGLHDIKTGETVRITDAQAISIYMSSQNEDNRRHFMIKTDENGNRTTHKCGGMNIPDERYYKKGEYDKAREHSHRVILSEDSLAKIKSHIENDEFLKKFANKTYDFFNVFSKQLFDEVSMALHNVPGSIKGTYFPIDVNKSYIKTEFENLVLNGKLENTGITKERVHSSAPIWISDVTDVINKHLETIASLNAFAVPLRNFEKIYNYTSSGYGNSVKAQIEFTWGKTATKYIENFIVDLNAQSTGANIQSNKTELGKVFSKFRSYFAQSVLATNLSVIFKQAASFYVAIAKLGIKPVMKSFVMQEHTDGTKYGIVRRAEQSEIDSITPLVAERRNGLGYNPVTGKGVNSLLDLSKDQPWAKKLPYIMDAIQRMDIATVNRLFYASKYYMEKHYSELKEGTDEYKEKLKEVYEYVINYTQPQYSTMHRPQALRTENELIKSVAIFMTQRLQNFGIVFDATGDFIAKKRELKLDSTEENIKAYKNAKVNLINGIVGVGVSAIVIAVMQFLYKALSGNLDRYRDDEEEITAEAIAKRMGIDTMESLFSNVFLGAELFSEIENIVNSVNGKSTFYETDLLDVNIISAVNDFVGNINDIISSTVQFSSYSNWTKDKIDKNINNLGEAIYGVLSGVLKYKFGVPVDNLKKHFESVYNHASDFINDQMFSFKTGSNAELNSSDYCELIYDSLIDGDKEKAAQLWDKAISNGKSETSLNTALKNILVDDETVYQCAVAKNDGLDYSDKKSVLKNLGFPEKIIDKAIEYIVDNILNEKEEEIKKETITNPFR